jgi:hypothetical protein
MSVFVGHTVFFSSFINKATFFFLYIFSVKYARFEYTAWSPPGYLRMYIS